MMLGRAVCRCRVQNRPPPSRSSSVCILRRASRSAHTHDQAQNAGMGVASRKVKGAAKGNRAVELEDKFINKGTA
jgi:hypothetical protein